MINARLIYSLFRKRIEDGWAKPAVEADPTRLRSLRRRIVIIVTVLNFGVAALICSFLWDYYQEKRFQAWTNAENLNLALDEGLEGRFSQIDIVLQSVADEYQRELGADHIDPAVLQAALDRQARRAPDIAGLRIANADGDIVYASFRDKPTRVNVFDREHFQAVRNDQQAGLIVSKPEFGRLTNEWVLLFARRLSRPDGAFAGEVHATVPVAKLEDIFSSLDIGRHGVVSLWNSQRTTIARFPRVDGPGGVIAMAPPPSPELKQLLLSGKTTAAYRATSGTDKIARTYYFRKMKRFPLYLIVGLADGDYGSDWGEVAMRLASLLTLVFVTTAVGARMIYLRARTREFAEAQSRLAASVYESSSEGMMIIDSKFQIVDVNKSFVALTGFAADEVRGWQIKTLLSEQESTDRRFSVARALIETGHWVGELWFRRKVGDPFLARISASLIRGVEGGDPRCVALFSDATEQKRIAETVWRHANFDTVTQLPNRRLFCERLHAAIRETPTENALFAVIFIDLDRFKDVNDRFGHPVGDQLLQQAAERIRACLRADDLVARLGGDEFTVMLPRMPDEKVVERVARSIVEKLAEPYLLSGERCFSSASLGVTLYPRDGSDVETLLRNADQAMYSAKRAGRNRLAFFAPILQAITTARINLASDLRAAIANGELELHYQPILDLASGHVEKAEALARWRHPKLGMVPPCDFIPIAEETGLIVEIGDWVFKTAATQALKWRRAADRPFQISVNVSPAQLNDADCPAAKFGRVVSELGLSPGTMIIEITESALLTATETVRSIFTRYHAAGIEIALDDFGTGYSSLAYLKDFEINYLKVDRAFVSSLTERSRDFAICEAIVVMAHNLGIEVVAEGVETMVQRDLLAKAGCDFAQGYLFSPPVPASKFEALFFGRPTQSDKMDVSGKSLV